MLNFGKCFPQIIISKMFATWKSSWFSEVVIDTYGKIYPFDLIKWYIDYIQFEQILFLVLIN